MLACPSAQIGTGFATQSATSQVQMKNAARIQSACLQLTRSRHETCIYGRPPQARDLANRDPPPLPEMRDDMTVQELVAAFEQRLKMPTRF